MKILGNLFYIVIFLCIIGSLFTILFLFLQKALKFVLPVWIGALGAIFYLVPIIFPQVKLISPEETLWLRGYEIACIIWLIGTSLFFIYYLLRGLFAYKAIKQYSSCEDKRLIKIYSECADMLNIEKIPPLLFGTLREPACVVTLLQPAVILKKDIVLRLSDKELQIVLSHELVHVKRKHHFIRRIYDIISILYWFNPLIWIVKHEFSYTCEMDCDKHALKALESHATVKEYISTMLDLMKASTEAGNKNFGEIGALSFLAVKQRFVNILNKPSRKKSIAFLVLVSLCVVFTLIFSINVSKSMFYPYPAYNNRIYEYSEITDW